MSVRKAEDMTPFEALDHVKAIRAGYNACIGSLYKNVAVGLMDDFLKDCIARWGNRFMECVEREYHEERFPKDNSYQKWHGDKGRRELVFPDCS